MESNTDQDDSSHYPLAPLAQITDGSRIPNLDEQINLPYTSTGSYSHYDQGQNFQPQVPEDVYQIAEQLMHSQAAYGQSQSFQAQAPNDCYQVAEPPAHSQAVYGQAQGFSPPVENGGHQGTADGSQSDLGPTQNMEDEKNFRASLKATAILYKKIMTKKDETFVAHETASKARLESVNAEIIRLQNGDRSKTVQIEQLNEKVNKLDTVCNRALNENQKRKEQLSVKERELNVSNAQIAALNGTLADKELEINQLNAKLGEIEQLNEKVNKLDADKNLISNENQNLNAKLEALEMEKQRLTETIREKTRESQILEHQLNVKERKVQESIVQTATLNGSLAEKEVEINQLKAQTNSLRGELAAEKKEKQKVVTKLETLQQQYDNVKCELAKKKKLATKTVQQNFVMVRTIVDAAQKTVSESNGEQWKSAKRPIPTIDIGSGTGANGSTEQEEVHSAKKIQKESYKRKRDVKILMCSSTTRYCDADESSHEKNDPSPQ